MKSKKYSAKGKERFSSSKRQFIASSAGGMLAAKIASTSLWASASSSAQVSNLQTNNMQVHSQKDIKHYSVIPYAEPPVGALRFAPPKPVKFDKSTLNHPSDTPGPVPPQTPSRLSRVMGDFSRPQSENCLNLALWTPGVDKKLRPVLFWIHGGGYSSGGGSLDWYDGNVLSHEGDVVVVSPNYRLGVLGFLCYPGLADGNQGILDLECALQWTRENIHLFGGDPDRITLVGQSAGAYSAALMASRMTDNLQPIHQIIMESAYFNTPLQTKAAAHQAGDYFLQALTKNNVIDANSLRMAQQAPIGAILAAQNMAVQMNANAQNPDLDIVSKSIPLFAPVSNDIQFSSAEEIGSYFARGAARVPAIIGWTREEVRAFTSNGLTPKSDPTFEAFAKPAMQWALNARKAKKPAYVYSFDWAPQGSDFGACHTIELPFVFGTLAEFETAPMLKNGSIKEMQILSKQVRTSWLAFIKTGNPNSASVGGLPNWPSFEVGTAPVMHINALSQVKTANKNSAQKHS